MRLRPARSFRPSATRWRPLIAPSRGPERSSRCPRSRFCSVLLQAATPVAVPGIDDVLAEWTSSTPGCAVGVEVDGKTVLEKGFGMADLERSVPNRGETIFEAGSVSKQFTAAAVLLLARDGKLSLDDPIREVLPEIPDYVAPVTIRQVLTHTSGSGLGQRRRYRRLAADHARVYARARPRHPVATAGAQLPAGHGGPTAIRATTCPRSSSPASAGCRSRRSRASASSSRSAMASTPGAMTTRLVPRRALAYSHQDDGYHLDLPFENVHGNGGLLDRRRPPDVDTKLPDASGRRCDVGGRADDSGPLRRPDRCTTTDWASGCATIAACGKCGTAGRRPATGPTWRRSPTCGRAWPCCATRAMPTRSR